MKECFKLIDKDNNDITVIRRVKRKDLKLRLLNVMLSSGECEYLITNIHDSSLCPDDFYELYFKRWGIIQPLIRTVFKVIFAKDIKARAQTEWAAE